MDYVAAMVRRDYIRQETEACIVCPCATVFLETKDESEFETSQSVRNGGLWGPVLEYQRPHIFLEPFIQGYLVLKVEAEVPVDEFLTAKPYSALAFFVNSKFKGQQQNVIFETSLSFRPEKIHLGGMLGKNIKWRIGGYGYLIYAIFTSTGLCHFMRENAGAALNTFVILDELNLKNDYEYLEEQIQLAECPIKAVQLIDNYLLNHFNKLKIPFSVKDMSPVTAYINRQKGIINMKQLEEKFRVSR